MSYDTIWVKLHKLKMELKLKRALFYVLNFLVRPSSVKFRSRKESCHWGWIQTLDFNLIRLVDSLDTQEDINI